MQFRGKVGKMTKYPAIIGRSEPVDIVDIALGVPAKVDTGAYRSSIHASDIKVKAIDGVQTLACQLLGHPCAAVLRPYKTTAFDIVTVKSSNGQKEDRYQVTLRIKLGNKVFNTSFTLTDRSQNLFPILIGRKAMKERFLVDANTSRVNRQQMMKDFGITEPRGEEDLED